MTSRHTKKGISAGISVAALVATAIGMADIAVTGGKIDKESNTPVKADIQQGSPETKKLALKDLSHSDLVKQLANDDFLTREEASMLLWRRGKPTLSALEKAVSSSNPELISRATELIRYVKIGISPDTPPRVTKLIQSFEGANQDKKELILRKLYAEKAYSQMLFMLSEMKDRASALDLYNNFNSLGHNAAKESIAKGDIEAAIEQLKLVPRSETSLRSLAFLYAQTGRLDAELDRLSKMNAKLVDKTWEMHLNLERPNRADIRKFAQRENILGVTANLDLLEGDPYEMYRFHAKKAPLMAKTSLALLKAQYEGEREEFIKKSHAQQVEILELSKSNKASNLVNQTIKSMCLTGVGNLAEPYMFKNHHYESFSYLESREQPKKALAAIGITDSESLQKFIQENTRLAIDEIEVEQEDMRDFRGDELIPYSTRLILVAEFYYNKGQPETAKKIIAPLLKEFQAQENKEWYNVIQSVANQRMHTLAIELVLDRGDGDNTYQQMVTYLYDETSETDLIWNTLLKRDDVTPEKSFRDLGVVMGIYKAELKAYFQLQKDLIKIATRQGVVSLKAMRSALLSVATYRQDTISAKRYAKQLLDTEDNKRVIPFKKLEYLAELSNGLDWKGIVTLLDNDSSIIQNSARWYAVYSIAKRKLGDVEGANRLLNHAKLVSTGLNDELHDIAREHYLAGYFEISTQIIERLLIIGSVNRDSNLYKFALGYLTNKAYTDTQQWGKAAAFYMVRSSAEIASLPLGHESSNLAYYTNSFYNAQFSRGMELYQAGKKAKGLKMLTVAHKVIVGDGNLADHFYPAIRKTDLTEQYNLWVDNSYQYLKRSIDKFPKCANTHNTIAWVLARAIRKIDLGIQHSEKALSLSPNEASYIDTMGELYHAKGERKEAIQWSEKAVIASKYGRLDTVGSVFSARMLTYSLSNQLERFKTEPHPKP
jgi:hypothetical protein